jgi:hypothetical protein
MADVLTDSQLLLDTTDLTADQAYVAMEVCGRCVDGFYSYLVSLEDRTRIAKQRIADLARATSVPKVAARKAHEDTLRFNGPLLDALIRVRTELNLARGVDVHPHSMAHLAGEIAWDQIDYAA